MIARFIFFIAMGVSNASAQTLESPPAAKAGAELAVSVVSAGTSRDFVAIVPKGSREGYYDAYKYVGASGSVRLMAPQRAGEYEIRLMGAKPPYPTLARSPLLVEPSSATLQAAANVPAGAKFQVRWTGPGHSRDFVTVVKSGAPEQRYDAYVYVRPGAVELRAPDDPGDYEIRYLAASSYATLARADLKVTPNSGSLQAPREAIAGETVDVRWQGPNRQGDYVTIVPAKSHEGSSGRYAYTTQGNPARIRTPLEPGEYEFRYSTGQSHRTLARSPIQIRAPLHAPGLISVSGGSASAGSAVEVIFDASGSMLQRMGGQRRIDIAKRALNHLASEILPRNSRFALRVFGREIDSCQTDLDIRLGPLSTAAVSHAMAILDVKNMARTPIGASIEKAAEDLSEATQERLVILLTDGEETCGGDPAAAIERLSRLGASTRVNIVGFAIDDKKLEATFRHWARAGNGAYFSASDPHGLDSALMSAARPAFEVVDSNGDVVAEGISNGGAVRVAAGSYTVRLKGAAKNLPVILRPNETVNVRF